MLAAFQRPVMDGCKRLAAEGSSELVGKAAVLIGGSQALQVCEREVVARDSQRLAAFIAEENLAPPADVEAWGAASALMGVQRALVLFVRAPVLERKGGPRFGGRSSRAGRRAFARLEGGLAGYAVRQR